MRKFAWVLALVLIVTGVLAGCGKKDAGTVVKDLSQKVESMNSYKAAGSMVIHSGADPISYDVEVWYQKDDHYRIELTNAKKDINQIILKNEDGVFVLTPSLNKSFRFQSDWPAKQGQIYLYQSLVDSIAQDQNRQFTTDNGSYVFDVAANYQNNMLKRQKVWFDGQYRPQRVQVQDDSGNLIVEMNFASFSFNPDFDDDAFDMERNMQASMQTLPTTAVPDLNDDPNQNNGLTKDKAQASASTGSKDQQESFGIIDPAYVPKGVSGQQATNVKLNDGSAVMLRYTGAYHYTLLEARPESRTVWAQEGELENLGGDLGYGVLIGDQMKTLVWTYNGVEYRLASGDLPVTEMVKVAQSVQGQVGK